MEHTFQEGENVNTGLFKHGHNSISKPTKTYKSWIGMRSRCNCKTDEKYPRYGGRGIRVCSRWDHFSNFLLDMGERPSGMTIDRIDNDGHYEPGNCRWATPTQQSNNTRTNRRIEFAGMNLTVTEWSKKIGISSQVINGRVKAGYPAKLVLRPFTNKLGRRWAKDV